MNIRLALMATFLAASVTHAMPSAQVFVGPVQVREILPQLVTSSGGISYWSIEYNREWDSAYNAMATLRIRGSASEGIESLQVLGWAGGETHIDIAGNSGARFGPIKAITKTNGNGHVALDNLFMAGDLGVGSGDAISVDYISTMDVLGSVKGGIATVSSASGSRIDNVLVSGNVEGRIYARLQVWTVNIGGTFGTASVPQQLSYGELLKKISAGSIYAEITSPNTGTGLLMTVNRIETTAGPFVGSLLCKKLLANGSSASGISISGGGTPSAGVLNANVSITTEATQPITATGGLAAGRTIKIAGSYNTSTTSAITITPAGGLDGQIIINADGTTGGDWNGNLTVNGVAASGKHYSQTNFGDGAVGLVPYWVHGEECYPPAGTTIPTPGAVETFYYTFYGPVKALPSETIRPITISRMPLYFGEQTWQDVTSSFQITVPGSGSRNVEIRAGSGWIELGYKYKVEPTSLLICDGLFAGVGDTPVNGNSYSFNVEGPVVTGD